MTPINQKLHVIMTFLETIKDINMSIMECYPDAFFYEAAAKMKDNGDGTYGPDFDLTTMQIVFGRTNNTTVLVTFAPLPITGEIESFIQEVPEPWLEDRPMSVYIPADLEEAYARYTSEGFVANGDTVILRHQLSPDPRFVEPQYLFTQDGVTHSVNVFTAKVA